MAVITVKQVYWIAGKCFFQLPSECAFSEKGTGLRACLYVLGECLM